MSNQEPKSEAFFKEGESPKDSSPYIEINKPKEKKDETPENIDQIACDKNNWNLDNIQIPDLSLKKQSESKLSIDAADMSNQRLKELLNEDLINAIDSSPMLTPKNMIKDATIENNNDNSNNENVVENSEDFNENELFQFSLYNNKSEKDEETNESNIIKTDEINKIKEDEGGGDLNLNNLNNNNIDIAPQIPNDNIINKEENKIIEPQKIEENKDKENKIESKDKSGNSKEKKKDNINNNNKNYYPSQYQYKFPFIQIPYVTQPIIKSINQMGYENKFDGNKKYQVIVPFTVLKKSVKPKKPFEIREGDWTCSNCNNLNFSFRVKCNRCELAKEQSEQNKLKENKEPKEQKHPQTKTKNYYSNPNMNLLQYKYCPRYICIPIQGQFNKAEKK